VVGAHLEEGWQRGWGEGLGEGGKGWGEGWGRGDVRRAEKGNKQSPARSLHSAPLTSGSMSSTLGSWSLGPGPCPISLCRSKSAPTMALVCISVISGCTTDSRTPLAEGGRGSYRWR
jgi:hypothetical protein